MEKNNHRILTNLGEDQHIKVELSQDFNLLEILSLKFTQKEIYTSLCSDYGVVVGRISVNNGLGIPNARVSIFIPIDEVDENNPLISSLYPFKTVNDTDDKNYRYNLLPKRKQHGGHSPTGTFPDQIDILNREEMMEVYEKYYKYTVRTNDSGDFMIWGVPLGDQILHVDVDLSDIGCFSLRPYDFITKGVGEADFKNSYEFKSSEDIDSLPQIKTFNKSINVYPFWGNEELCEIGITRSDFDLSDVGVKIEPKAYLIGGTYTDTNKNSVNKNCSPRVKMGRKCDLQTKTGIIEAIRFTGYKDSNNRPILEKVEEHYDIPDDGGFVIPVPMNMGYIYTNEMGEIETTNNPNKGVPTSSCYRFRISLDDRGNSRLRKSASYLVPNIREYDNDLNKSYAFSTNWSDYPSQSVNEDPDCGILYNEYGEFFPRDYFFRMTYNKVYTVSSFHSMYYSTKNFKNDRYLGLKELVPTEEEDCGEIVTPPVNYGTRNRTFLLIFSEIFLLFEHLANIITFFIINTLVRLLFQLGMKIDFRPIRKVAREVISMAYSLQADNQRELYLISYPECEQCTETEYGNDQTDNSVGVESLCKIGSLDVNYPVAAPMSDAGNPTFDILTGNPNDPCQDITLMITGTTQNEKIQNLLNLINNTSGTNPTPQFYVQINNSGEFLLLGTGAEVELISYTDPSTPTITQIKVKFDEPAMFSWVFGMTNFTIYRSKVETINTNIQLEEGCSLYDTPYNETLITYYYVGTDYNTAGTTTSITPGSDIQATNISNATNSANYNGSNVVGDIPHFKDNNSGKKVFHLRNYNGEHYYKKTRSGQTEFRNGIFTFVPGAQTNNIVFEILKEYRRRKRVGKLFCGGVVNYSFVENWLSGSLYFFQFKGKKNKYCKDIVRYIETEKRFYYRSSLFNKTTNKFGRTSWNGGTQGTTLLGRPTTMVDLGPRDEFIKEICMDKNLDPNCSVARSIGPTSFQNFGELMGLAINYRMDVSNNDFDIKGFFDNKGFDLPKQEILDGDIMQLISINNEIGIEEFDLQNPKYLGYSYQVLDPDHPSTMNVFKGPNGKYGPLPITFYFDEDGERVRSCINEPTHLDNNGYPVQGRLTESSQKVPFFLWDKKGTGFGPYDDNTHDDQSWSYNDQQIQPLQGMTYAYNLNNPNDDSSDRYLLLPMTYTFSGLTLNTGNATNDVEFNVIETGTDNHTLYDNEYPGFTYLYVTSGTITVPLSGILYTRYGHSGTWHVINNWDYNKDFIIRKTQDYYNGNKQILSTPFMFYFGLKAGKTGIDKFIQFFGDKDVFTTEE